MLDALRPARHPRLAAQRRELPRDLADQIFQAREVALHRFELAYAALSAAPVLEHTGGLFDEASALFRCGLQDLVQLTLPDDHVHLPAKPGI